MKTYKPDTVASEITAQSVYADRRRFMKSAGTLGLAVAAANLPAWAASPSGVSSSSPGQLKQSAFSIAEPATSFRDVTTYNNFYEFGTDKSDPARYAHTLVTNPWTLQIDGLVKKPVTLDLDALMRAAPLEERIYRMRCVEGWSMVIPWLGYPLSALLKKVQPLGSAKYVAFTSQADPKTMPGVRRAVLDWPYTEGLRLDEAMHPLTLLTMGLYGQWLPNQNGAPVRVVVPWKYGFKSAKSIVRISFTETQPKTAWSQAIPSEYGFYSNVNPQVDHPRWSQARERRIGEFLKRETLMFNGYADQVASLYTGMDLKKFY